MKPLLAPLVLLLLAMRAAAAGLPTDLVCSSAGFYVELEGGEGPVYRLLDCVDPEGVRLLVCRFPGAHVAKRCRVQEWRDEPTIPR